jgi:hypothetical protein
MKLNRLIPSLFNKNITKSGNKDKNRSEKQHKHKSSVGDQTAYDSNAHHTSFE